MFDNEAVEARFVELLALFASKSTLTRILSATPTFRVPRLDGKVGVLSLDDVGPPQEPALRIVWYPECCDVGYEPMDLTHGDDCYVLEILLGVETG